MSFQEIAQNPRRYDGSMSHNYPYRHAPQQQQQQQQRRPKIVVQPPPFADDENTHNNKKKAAARDHKQSCHRRHRRYRPVVLHGKVQHVHHDEDDDEDEDDHDDDDNDAKANPASSYEVTLESIRQRLQRQSTYSQLAAEVQQFQKLVSELTSLFMDDQSAVGETPEAAWRCKILCKSATETDHELATKLHQYETTLSIRNNANNNNNNKNNSHYRSKNKHAQAQQQQQQQESTMRTAQTACIKLRRDFQRSHKALLMALCQLEKQQRAEVSRLGAIGWTTTTRHTNNNNNNNNNNNTDHNNHNDDDEDDYDFFDKAMRQRELERMNTAMHQVNGIYQELATLVETQQDDIDKLDDNILDATENVQAAASCLGFKNNNYRMFFCGAFEDHNGGGLLQEEWGFLRQMDSALSLGEEKTVDTTTATPAAAVAAAATAAPTHRHHRHHREHRDHTGSDHRVRSGVRVSEKFHWYMPFETITQDMESVKRDLVGFGKDVLTPKNSKQR